MIASAAYEQVVPSSSVRAVLESKEAENWVIAGGAALAIASGCEVDHGDVDLFCVYARAPTLPTRLALMLKSALQIHGDVAMSSSGMAHTLRSGSMTLQVIRRPFASFDDLFGHFDLPCCEFAYDPRAGYVVTSDRGDMALRSRVIDSSLIRTLRPASVSARIEKYTARGFRFEGEAPDVLRDGTWTDDPFVEYGYADTVTEEGDDAAMLQMESLFFSGASIRK